MPSLYSRFVRRALVAVLVAAFAALVLQPASGARAAALGSFSCMPVSGLSSRSTNPPDDVMKGIVRITGFSAVNVGTGAINWGLDPFGSSAWRRLFHSLKWVETLTDAYTRTGNSAYLARARAIGQDYAAHVPAGGGAYPGDIWTPMYSGQRSTVFSCLEAKGGSASWITSAMVTHGTYLAANDPGDWNQGVDATIGLLSSACRTGNATWASQADTRFARMSTATIGPEGEVLEQAPGYGAYLATRWIQARDKMRECGRTVPAALATRLPLLRDFLAWMTTPAGTVEQIGDSAAAASEAPGATDALGYAVSKGATGTPPGATTRIFGAGYAAGRDAWSPFGTSMHWTVRWGPGRAYHGHEDHTSVTMYAYGQQLLVDSGHYAGTGVARDYVISAMGHNTTVAPGATFAKSQPTTLLRQGSGTGWNFFEMTDKAWDGRARMRRVLVDTDKKTMLINDSVSRATAGPWWQLWHLPVGGRVTLSGRSTASMLTANGATKLTLQQIPGPTETLQAGSMGMYNGSTSPYMGWVSRTTSERVAAPVVVFARALRSTGILAVAVATAPGSTVSTSSRMVGTSRAIDVTIDGQTTTYWISGGGSMWK